MKATLRYAWLICCFLLLNAAAQPIKTIHFATVSSYPPFEYKDYTTGEVRGYDIDIAKALCKQINAQCDFTVEAAWENLLPQLQKGKYDAVIAATSITPAREQLVSFTEPYFNTIGSIVAKTSAHLTLDEKSLTGKAIGLMRKTVFENYIKAQYPLTNIAKYDDIEDALLDLTTGKIDAVMGDAAVINNWLRNQAANEYSVIGKPITDPKYLGKGLAIAVQKGNVDLLTTLNSALAAIRVNGIYQKITSRYF